MSQIGTPLVEPERFDVRLQNGHIEIRGLIGGLDYPANFDALPADQVARFVYATGQSPSPEVRGLLAVTQVREATLLASPDERFVDVRRMTLTLVRDLASGNVVTAEGQLVVPPEASRQLRLKVELIGENGMKAVDSVAGEPFIMNVESPATATLCFFSDWHYEVDGIIKAGQEIAVAYDTNRVYSRLRGTSYNGLPTWSVIASLVFSDEAGQVVQRQEFPLKVGGFPTVITNARVPDNALHLELWFRGTAMGGVEYDSRFGDNYTFPVAP